MKRARSLLPSIAVIFALSLVNLVIIYRRLHTYNSLKNTEAYSYVGNDFPELLPLDKPIERIPRVFTNTTEAYPIHGPLAEGAWERVYPNGFGFVRLGPSRRILCVSMFHQLHCVEKLRRALADPDDPIATIPHLQHCMNYIRQMVLCGADTTLEPVTQDPVTGLETTGVGVTHMCQDWNVVYDTINNNYARWLDYWETVKDTVPSS